MTMVMDDKLHLFLKMVEHKENKKEKPAPLKAKTAIWAKRPYCV